jgi:hypothetical protein
MLIGIIFMMLLLATGAHGQIVIDSPAEGEVSALRNQAIIGQAPAGMTVHLAINGIPSDSATARADGVFEFLGITTSEGPVTFSASITMRNGKKFSAERSIHTLGAPHSIVTDLPDGEIPADGRTTLAVTANVLDRWGKLIPEGYFVTLSADSMHLVVDDADTTTPGIQVALKRGKAEFLLQAGTRPGPSELLLSANGVTLRQPLYLTTPTQPFMLTGVVSATGSILTPSGATTEFSGPADMSKGFHSRGRIAATGRGTVLDRYLLTLSVDSERRIGDQLFRTYDPNILYTLYGDNSVVYNEAQSASPVFAKIERDRSSLMYGDFNTALAQNEFATYNRTFTGGRLHLESSDFRGDAFATVTNRRVSQEEIRGTGGSGYYFLRNSNIVTGSEKVRIEVRDRFRSEVVISSREKARFIDYDIDYTQGTIYFKQPVGALDDQNNPIYIVVSSEAITDDANNYVAGGAGEVTLLKMLTLGASGVVEQRSPSNYMLLGGNAGLSFNELGSIRGEVARSSYLDSAGIAWKVEGKLNLLDRMISLRPYYRRVESSFINANQSGSGRELGTTKYGSALDIQPFAGTLLTGDYYRQDQLVGEQATEIRSLSGGIRQTLWSGSAASVKLEDVTYDGPDPDPAKGRLQTRSMLLVGRVDATLLKDLTGHVEYDRNLAADVNQTKPNAFGGGLDYQILPSVAIFAQHRILEQDGRLTNMGIRTKLGESTSLYGQYETGVTPTGEQRAASIGLRNSLKITDYLTFNLLLEKTKNLSQSLVEVKTPDHDAFSASLEYTPSIPLKAVAKGEYNADIRNRRMSFTYGVDYRLTSDLSLQAKGKYFNEESLQESGLTRQAEYIFGVAYRPIAADWLNLIGRVELNSAENRIIQPTTRYRATIVSAHAIAEPLQHMEIGAKYALKSAADRFDDMEVPTLTDFILLRSQYDITSWLDIAAEGRWLRQHEAGDLRFGYSAELGFSLLENTTVIAGYNFQGYAERDLVDPVYSVQGPYMTMRLKFTEELLGMGE